MKKFKRFLAVMLTAVMLITAAPLTGFAAYEEGTTGSLTYRIINNHVMITRCNKNASGKFVIPSEIDGYPVESIQEYAFENCTSIKSITIPENITYVGFGAFRGCTSLKELNYYAVSADFEGMPWDYPYPFENLTSIEKVTIGDSVLSIPSGFLFYCIGLTDITIPDSVTSIGGGAFYGCEGLTRITIPKNVTSVGDGAFNGCDSLKELNYNATSAEFYEDYYNSYPFGYLTSIERVTIGENVTSIPDGFLRGCSGFNNIIIPDSVTRIGNDAFYGCTALTSITIPENVTSVGYGAFNGCDSLKDLNYNATSAIFELEDWYYNSPFEKIQSIERVTIGENVTSLPDCFLRGCTGFNNITIPDSVTNIGRSAFQGCIGISDIIIPENVSDIGGYAFCGCSSLTSVIIPENVKSIGNGAFSDSVSTVYFNAINCNTARDSFTGSINGITISFGGSTVKNMIISDKVQSLPSRIFYDCDELTEIKIPASVTYIGDRAFSNCEKLTNVIFSGDGEIELGNEIFNASYNATICCKENSYMHFYAEKMGLNYCILNENNDPTFTIKNDVLISYSGNDENLFFGSASKIGFGAFKDNTDLKSVELSSNVTRVYNQAFKNCTGLEKIIIPQSVASIGEDAFAGCDKLTVWCYAGSFAEAYAVNHEIPVKYITLNLSQDEVNLTQYETATLCASFNIDLSDNADMVWTSDNPSVVTVTPGGKITAVGVGEAVITATSANGLYAKCIVKVGTAESKGSIKSVSLDDVEMKYKDTKQLYPIIEADDSVDYTVTYTSSDNSVARVDESGNVYAAKRGSADITVTVTDDFGNTVTDTCSVKVNYSFWQWVIKILLFGWIWY